MKNPKVLIAVILLIATMAVSNALPKAKYIGTNFITNLQVPLTLPGWQGKNVTNFLNLNLEEARFGFINDALAYEYVNNNAERLLFIILDAGNFHHPKNCFVSSGYDIKEIPDAQFNLKGQPLKAHALYSAKGTQDYIHYYWIVINKNNAHQWVEQKLKQLYFSMLNKKRVGLMVRIDVPVKESNTENAFTLAEQLITDLYDTLGSEQIDYIFGKQ
jgi:EpsI family protein